MTSSRTMSLGVARLAAVAEDDAERAVAPDRTRGRARTRNALAVLLGGVVVAAAAFLAWSGRDYYRLDLERRVRSPLHPVLKPGGTVGKRLGIAGTVLMLANLAYVARRRLRRLEGVGTRPTWLALHVFCGITGPAILVFHSAFLTTNLFARITAVSTLVVVVTGLIGRYVYAQIPRSISGRELTLAELEARRRELLAELEAVLPPGERTSPLPAAQDPARAKGGPRLVLLALRTDLARFVESALLGLRLLRRGLGWQRALAGARATASVASVSLRVTELHALQRVLARWRSLHLKLALVMVLAMAVHVAVVTLLGYGIA